MAVGLEDLYNGKTRKLAVTREICCEKCKGKGGSKVEKCTTCQGRGMKVMTKQIGKCIFVTATLFYTFRLVASANFLTIVELIVELIDELFIGELLNYNF